MNTLIQLSWKEFDPRKEPENPYNNIYGHSLLRRLQGLIQGLTEPSPEDWGWYSTLQYGDRCYTIGASSEEHSPTDFILQIAKHRSRDPNSRRVPMNCDDSVLETILKAVQSEAGFADVSLERGP